MAAPGERRSGLSIGAVVCIWQRAVLCGATAPISLLLGWSSHNLAEMMMSTRVYLAGSEVFLSNGRGSNCRAPGVTWRWQPGWRARWIWCGWQASGVHARCRQVMGTVHGTEIFISCCPDISRDTARDIVDLARG